VLDQSHLTTAQLSTASTYPPAEWQKASTVSSAP
jgi:hypothetical protein